MLLPAANLRKEMAAGWLPKVFSVRQPAPATYCTPRCSGANIGSYPGTILYSVISMPSNGKAFLPRFVTR